ncbi:hypothetical protein BGZ54_002338, partial [Gamsiella multidivaricata]
TLLESEPRKRICIMESPSSLSQHRHARDGNEVLPVDPVIQIFMHLSLHPQDLLNCALTTRHWARPALQELYRHPWTYLFNYQFDTEGRVMDKHGSMLLLRTLFQGCTDPTKTTFPYASFARSVNLKWVHDTFDLPEVDIQTLTGLRWTRNEAPKDFLIRHLLANRPYLNDFVHCHAPRLPRCLFAHMTTATVNNFADEVAVEGTNASTALAAEGVIADGSVSGLDTATTINTANTASTDSDDWANMMQQVTDDEFMPSLDVSLLTTPPLLPVQQPIATAMPLVHSVTASTAAVEEPSSHSGSDHNDTHESFLQILNSDSTQSAEVAFLPSPPSPILLTPALDQPGSHLAGISTSVVEEIDQGATAEVDENTGVISVVEEIENATTPEGGSEMAGTLESTLMEPGPETTGQVVVQSLSAVLASASSSSAQSIPNDAHPVYAFQHPYASTAFSHPHSRAATPSSGSSSSRPFLATWPLTMEQTHSLVYLDLRYAIVSDSLIVSLALNCHKIERLKVATHWQHYPHSYSVTDNALTCLVAAQQCLKLLHVENHREISQGHELVRTIDTLGKVHGSSLETLVLKSHDFQNCNLAAFGKACKKLVKFAAPGGMHLFREEVLQLTEACKLTLEHLDFSNSDIETDSLMAIMKGTSSPQSARGTLKALILLGMEDTLNTETCLAIGEYASGLDCFRLDILESEAKDVSLMLSRSCALNLRVLTLGCHDVHGDLANDILEQIALNCKNVELLDVNHWQFSAKAIKKVLRECGMLRYLNVSYTDLEESTADIICRCLGEVKKATVVPVSPPADDSISTPSPAAVFTSSQLQTPATIQMGEAVVQESIVVQEEWSQEASTTLHNSVDETVENLDEERPDILRKRGVDMRAKGDEDGDEEDYMDTNMDSDQQHATPVYSANGGKKQSQMGLVHHHLNAMDLRTIMNLDLDEAIEMDLLMGVDEDTGMDLDMCLDLQRYHRNSSYKGIHGDQDNAEGEDMDMTDVDDEEAEIERAMMGTANDIDEGDEDEDGSRYARSKEPKGKEVYIDRDFGDNYQDNVSTIFTSLAPTYSSSYGSTSSSASSSSSSSGSSANIMGQAQSGQVLLSTAETGSQALFDCMPLLPPLPIPSMQVNDNELDPMAVSMSTSVYTTGEQAIQGPPATGGTPECTMESEQVSYDSQATPTITSADDTCTASEAETPSSASTETRSDETPVCNVSEAEEEAEAEDKALTWTRESRLEQVNVECCTHLSLATMSKIKTLACERQADLARQGRKKSRIWVENEHDMMMTRLTMERGPELPAWRMRTSIITGESNASSTGDSVDNSNASGTPSSDAPAGEGSPEQHSEQPPQGQQQQQQQLEEEMLSAAVVTEDEPMISTATVEVVA